MEALWKKNNMKIKLDEKKKNFESDNYRLLL